MFKTEKLYNYGLMAVAFLLPFMPKALNIFIGLLLLLFIIGGNFKEKFRQLLNNPAGFISVIIYLLYVFSLCWSENFRYGWLDVQIKLSLLIFPFLFAGISVRNSVLYSFVTGCLAALLICSTRAVYLYPTQGIEGFYYQKFSYFIHPGYFAMYVNLAVCILFHELIFKSDLNNSKKLLIFSAAIFLIAGILLLSSKAGIFLLILTLIASIIFLIVRNKSRRLAVTLAVILTGSLLFSVASPEVFKRWSEMSNTLSGTVKLDQGHTTGQRLKAWESSLSVIKENAFTGVGIGDVKDALLSKYRELDYQELIDKNLNSHNQFFQTTIAIGISGFVLLFWMILSLFTRSLKSSDFLGIAFVTIFLFNILIESVLEVQAGVIFFAFFNGFFGQYKSEEKP